MTDAFADQGAAVRYHVKDVGRAAALYTEHLGFKLEHRAGNAFAAVSRGPLMLLLGGPSSSGSRPLPDGRMQEPGGWNRIVPYVPDLAASIERLRKAQVSFRNDVETGPGGSQIQLEDPDGNPIELHHQPRRADFRQRNSCAQKARLGKLCVIDPRAVRCDAGPVPPGASRSDFISEGFPEATPTLITYEQDARAAHEVWTWVSSRLRKYGYASAPAIAGNYV
jgi:glyoxylase I family protein